MPLDDPMLALITRFVIREADALNRSDEQYLREQFDEVLRYISRFPEAHREQAAMDWVTRHAEKYRREWQQRKLSSLAANRRCADCPLIDNDSRSTCMIHKRWVGLLNEYTVGEIRSDRYIRETLRLLAEHKGSLRKALVSPKA